MDDQAMRVHSGILLIITIVFWCLWQPTSWAAGSVVVFGDDLDFPPYSFLDAQGQPTGFSVELVQAIGKLMGWDVVIELDHWSRVKDKLANGEIDAIAGMFYTDERAQRFDFALRHAVASGEVFTREGDGIRSLDELQNQRVAVQDGDVVHEFLRALELDIELVPLPTVQDALRLVSAGEVDFAAVLRVPGYYAIERYGLTNVQGNGVLLGEHDYSIAVHKDNTQLLLAINEGLQILKATGRYAELYDKWIGVYEKTTFLDIVRSYAVVIVLLAVLSAAGWVWVVSLRRAVSYRTTAIQEANAKLTEQFELLREAERELAAEKDLLSTTLLSVGDGVIVTDCLGSITMLNPAAEALLGWPANQAVGREFHEVFCLQSPLDPLRHVMSTESPMELEKERIKSRDGREFTVASTFAPILDAGGQVRGGVVVFRDITLWVESQERIEFLSYCDPLTGLFNRRYFQLSLDRFADPCFLPLSIVMADVNGLKLTNDAFGHTVGDALLVNVADVLRSVVGDAGICARLGGDEFAVLLPNTDSSDAQKMISKIRKAAAERKVADLKLSISFGWETREMLGRPMADVLKRAEDRMYKQKLLERSSYRAETISVILQSLYEKIPSEEKHAKRVAELCALLGEALDLYPEQVEKLYTIGLLHDIGKISIDPQLLEKPEPLTAEEYADICRHSEIGYRIVGAMSDMVDVSEYILSHHERFDGEGYPRGLQGRQIPYYARIVAVADAWDAMTSSRPYREPLSLDAAALELERGAGAQFDPRIVEVFLTEVLPKLAVLETAAGEDTMNE